MSGAGTLWRVVPRPIRETPADLGAVVLAVIATNLAVFAPVLRETPLRIPLGLAFVLFIPGYALAAALYPRGRRADPDDETNDTARSDGKSYRDRPLQAPISGGERFVLSIGMSVAIVPLLGLFLHFGPGTIGLRSIIGSISAVTLVATCVGIGRRLALAPTDRFRVPYERWTATARDRLVDAESRPDAALHVCVVIVLLFAVGSVGYAVVALQPGEQFSAASVLTETDDGDLVAGEYPRSFEEGEPREFVFGLENREHRTAEYTVVVVEQRVESGDEGAVVEQNELQRFETQLAHDQTWHHAHDVRPTLTGENVRIAWLVYLDGDVPAEPSFENAAYSTHRWIEVSAADE